MMLILVSCGYWNTLKLTEGLKQQKFSFYLFLTLLEAPECMCVHARVCTKSPFTSILEGKKVKSLSRV